MQLGPNLGTGAEDQQADRLAAVAQRQHEQPRAPVLPAVALADGLRSGCGSGAAGLAADFAPKSVITSLAGFAGAWSVVASLVGFAGGCRPQLPGGRKALPAAFR